MKEPVAGNEPLMTGYTCKNLRAESFRAYNQLCGPVWAEGTPSKPDLNISAWRFRRRKKDPGECVAQGADVREQYTKQEVCSHKRTFLRLLEANLSPIGQWVGLILLKGVGCRRRRSA